MADLELTGDPLPDAGDDFISTADAAEILGVSAGTVRRWVKDGNVGSRRQGRLVFVRRDDILARQQRPAKPKPAQATLDILPAEARRETEELRAALEAERQARKLAQEKVRALSLKVAELRERVEALEQQRQPWWAFWRL